MQFPIINRTASHVPFPLWWLTLHTACSSLSCWRLNVVNKLSYACCPSGHTYTRHTYICNSLGCLVPVLHGCSWLLPVAYGTAPQPEPTPSQPHTFVAQPAFPPPADTRRYLARSPLPRSSCISLLHIWFSTSCTSMVLNVSVHPPCVFVLMHGSRGTL